MSLDALVPLMIVAGAVLPASALHRWVAPRVAASALTVALCAVLVTVVPLLIVASIGFMSHLPGLHGALGWCRHAIGLHESVPTEVGVFAVAVSLIGAYRAVRVLRGWRSVRRCTPGRDEVIDSDELFAFSMPGPGRRVAISTGLIEALDPDEFEAVMAHERSHASHRHDRHLLIADLAVAVVPALSPVRRRLRFALERWADESAVRELGGDRERLAHTLARVAFAHAESVPTLAHVGGLGVAARVEALLRPPVFVHQRWWFALATIAGVIVAGAAAIQAHHIGAVVSSLCPG